MIPKQDAQNILHASLLFNELFKKTMMAAIPTGINTKTQMDVLVTLFASGPMNMSTLSSRISIAPEQTTRTIKSLREANLVQCERSPENRRKVIARLSGEGQSLLEHHLAELHNRLEICLHDLSEDDLQALVSASATAVKVLQKTGFEALIIDK